MAELQAILEQHKDKIGDLTPDGFNSLSTKLTELGYDVLINHREKAEFVPTSRLNDVVGQRDQFKSQATELNKQLQAMKDAAKGNEELQKQLQGLMDNNNKLLADLENTKVDTEIMLAAKDAVNPKDVLVFVNRDNIKLGAKGEVLGVEAEIKRIMQEKPYLFKSEQQRKKGGSEGGGGEGGKEKFNMNFLIRSASGRAQG